MGDMTITSVDLARNLKTPTLVVPPMPAEVILKNPSADLLKAFKDGKLIVQKIGFAATEVLNEASETIHRAIGDLDRMWSKAPPADTREAESRVTTLNAMCKKIADGQSSAASKAAEAEWDRQVSKNKDLTKYRAVFALKMTLGTISVALSVTTAVLSMGTLAVTILGGAQTLLSMAATTYSFCRGMDKAEKDIIETDRDLAKSWTDKKLTKDKVARELAAALGVPFVKSVVSLQTLLTEYDAKNAKKDKMAEDMWSEAKKLMAKIETASKQGSEQQRIVLKKLGTAVDSLLSQIGKLSKTSASNDLFYDAYKARCDTYRAMEGGTLGKTADATGVMVVLAGIASSAKTVVDVAMTLA